MFSTRELTPAWEVGLEPAVLLTLPPLLEDLRKVPEAAKLATARQLARVCIVLDAYDLCERMFALFFAM